jgi:hypothetical protein
MCETINISHSALDFWAFYSTPNFILGLRQMYRRSEWEHPCGLLGWCSATQQQAAVTVFQEPPAIRYTLLFSHATPMNWTVCTRVRFLLCGPTRACVVSRWVCTSFERDRFLTDYSCVAIMRLEYSEMFLFTCLLLITRSVASAHECQMRLLSDVRWDSYLRLKRSEGVIRDGWSRLLILGNFTMLIQLQNLNSV